MLAVLGAIGLTNLYNLACGGAPIFKVFFYPLYSSNYMDGSIGYPLELGVRPWVFVLLLMLAVLAWSLFQTTAIGRIAKKENIAPFAACLSVLGLVSFSYYANRSAWMNLEICLPEALLCLCFPLQALTDGEGLRKKLGGLYCTAAQSVGLAVLLVLCVLTAQLPGGVMNTVILQERGAFSTRGIYAEVENFSANIPDNTFAVGRDVGIIYHAAGWDNYGHYVDAADYGVADTEKLLPHILAELKAQPSFVVDDILGVYLGQNATRPTCSDTSCRRRSHRLAARTQLLITTTKSNKKGEQNLWHGRMRQKPASRSSDGRRVLSRLQGEKDPYQEGDRITYAARVFDEKEMCALTDATLDFWLTTGRFADRFEKEFAKWIGVKFAHLVNSGSSANLIAFMALTAPELGDRQIRKGDEIITVACGFPTTVTPAIQYGAVPVFVDVTVPQYNIDVTKLEAALSPKTKAVMIAHTLGNPFDLSAVKAFCDAHNLWLVEDNCDALGTQYTINGETRFTGTWGDIGTSSFYPPHHMTMGEGGCVYTNNPLLNRLILSFRDWGRDCICPSGQDNFCGHRFDGQFGELPKGYDHKYVYSHFGYNLKVTDMQAAIGCEQLKKFPSFIERRRHNWNRLRAALEPAADKLILPEPAANSRPSWFGFLISVKPESGLNRNDVTRYVESHNVQTRLLFSGNLIKHPCFDQIRGTDATAWRAS